MRWVRARSGVLWLDARRAVRTVSALFRVMPWPPARVESRNTKLSEFAWLKRSMARCRTTPPKQVTLAVMIAREHGMLCVHICLDTSDLSVQPLEAIASPIQVVLQNVKAAHELRKD